MPEHYGFWSIVPALLAILLAMLTRRVLISLLLGVAVAELVLAAGNLRGATEAFAKDLYKIIANTDNLKILGFTVLMGAMISIIQHSGGMLGLVHKLRPFATNRSRGQLVTWLLGLIIFFDDYANTLLLGTTCRPVTDRLKISREKLAYIVDSTAAPIAGIAVVSTWVAGEIAYINTGLDKLQIDVDANLGFSIFVETIVYRFYPLLALLFVGMVAVTRRDFGPMLTAERKALNKEAQWADVEIDTSGDANGPGLNAIGGVHLVAMPVAMLLVSLVFLLYVTGRHNTPDSAGLWEIFVNGESYTSLIIASTVGLMTAILLTALGRRMSAIEMVKAILSGSRVMLPAVAVLWLAWTLAALSADSSVESGNRLGTTTYIWSLVGDKIAAAWLPTLVFLLAGVVSYCTGTSWGTMAILFPLVVPIAWNLVGDGSSESVNSPAMLSTIGSVLAGSIFGDHCSPISDTTILSSRASSCDHIAHVWTQMPYALTVAGVSIVAGTIPVGFGVSVWIALPVSVVLLFGILMLVGRRAEDSADRKEAS